MKFVVTGATGQVGWELARQLPALGEVVALDRTELDLGHPDQIRRVMREIRPDVVVNAAAYTAVDQAESDPELARRINAVAPGVIADEICRRGGLLVHYSTDYVFDGTKSEPYTEEDETNPLSAYGASKLEGERAIRESGVEHMIFRTSWIYGVRGKNFLLTMLRLFHERTELKVVADQIGAPTWSRWIAQATVQSIDARLTSEKAGRGNASRINGVFHMTARGATSWFGFASAIRERYAASSKLTPQIVPVSTAEYPLAAKRPQNSILSSVRLSSQFGIRPPGWESLLDLCMRDVDSRTTARPL